MLGAIMLSDRAMYSVVIDAGLRPDHFYRERHRVVYAAMLALYERSEPIDQLTVTEQLRKAGQLEEAGGPEAIDEVAGPVPNVANLRQYAQIVRDDALLRALLNATYAIQASVLDQRDGAREIVEHAERTVLELTTDQRSNDSKLIGTILDAELPRLQKLSTEETHLTGTPSGFDELDAFTGGFQHGSLVVIAGRPSMGKSSLVANMAEAAAIKHERPVLLFSLEMSESELAQRFIASQASIHGDLLRKGRVTENQWPKIVKAGERLSKAPLWIDDSGDIGLLEIRAKSRRLHAQQLKSSGGLGLIIVDYLQLMRPDGRTENRVEQIGQISRGLKLLARELDVPVVALSQLNRGVEQRNDKRPLLSDLRESGAIEQDADLVLFIYRDEVYNAESEDAGLAELIISKHRTGAIGKVTLTFQREYPRFMNRAREERFGQ